MISCGLPSIHFADGDFFFRAGFMTEIMGDTKSSRDGIKAHSVDVRFGKSLD